MLQFQEARHLLMVWNKDALGGFLQKINRLGGASITEWFSFEIVFISCADVFRTYVYLCFKQGVSFESCCKREP